MKQESPVARAYILTEKGFSYSLEYYIYNEKDNKNENVYGIRIELQSDEDIPQVQSVLISNSENETIALIDSYAKNYVFPCNLYDLVQDKMVSGF